MLESSQSRHMPKPAPHDRRNFLSTLGVSVLAAALAAAQ
jgi:hypothetical protein